MKIVADDRIPFLRGVLEPFAEVVYLPGAKIAPADVADADALIVRTRTRCDAALLHGSRVRSVATATIGFDHLDTAALDALGVAWSNAPGCNAQSVKNYIASALAASGEALRGRTLGVVGVGHVGSLVAAAGEALGMRVLRNDPPRAEAEGPAGFVELPELLEASDIVTLHVPLERSGRHPTVHLADRGFFRMMRSGAWFFNSCRGEAVDPAAFLAAKRSGRIALALMDVWPCEPAIDPELLAAVEFATPHIAGYSVDGKANGTAAAVRFTAKTLGIAELAGFTVAELPPPIFAPEIVVAPGTAPDEAVRRAILHAYDIRRDTAALRADPGAFEQLRGSYWKRREFSAYTVYGAPPEAAETLKILGFALGDGK